ncbi:MAG: phage protein GemA/Gp16 family protein [Thermodesulfobacteriota bacterium]
MGRKKALIHIAKEDLHLKDETCRQILKGVAGVESSTQLNREGFMKVMKRFQEMGFKGLLPNLYQPVPKGRLIPYESPFGFRIYHRESEGFYLLPS